MTRLHLILYIVLLLFSGQVVCAQDNTLRQVYAQADENYQIGRIDEALTLLKSHIGNFQGSLKQSAFRLMALCSMGQDNNVETERYIGLLLQEDPYYSPSAQDPIRFVDLINKFKSGKTATITTASNHQESLEEAPVPVTLITENMIRESGARNLKEVLIMYVPGMTNVECNEEMNIAMRGIYSSGQEKILMMLNGHRLNSYGTNVACPDFSISLEKVKQIEVLRGPASSLYGGVALTAVINIITKNGVEADGLKVKGGIGNYGQLRGDVVYGKHYLDFDLMAWGSIYKSDGQKFYLPISEQHGAIPVDGDIIIGGFNQKPSYDVGFVAKWRNLTLMHNTNFSKTVAPYSLSYFFSPYDYDRYGLFNGNAPGYAIMASHSSMTYKRNLWKNLTVSATLAYDRECQDRYQVMTDTFPSHEMMYYYEVPGLEDVFIYPELYTFQYLTWNENCMTMSLNFDYQYQFGKHHSGSISFGYQNGRYHLEDAHNQEGDMGNRVLITYDDFKNLMPGREHMQNAYFQLKHRWHNFIFNAGLRYDRKLRNDDDVLREFSPRVALVFLQPRYDIKLSYSKSFVDAPYFYRNNTLDVYNGSGLDPEYLNSVQFTISGHQLIRGLELELNTFYNKASDLIWSTGYFYANSGVMKSVGLEASASYTRNRLHAHANLEWQYVIDTENYTAKGTHIYNVPRLSSNVTASYQIIKNLIVNANVNILSRQVSHYRLPIEEIIENNKEDIEISIPPRAVFNVGASYKWKNLELGLNAYNLFNRNYEQGGSTIGPIRQQGRWLMFSLAYKFI